MHSKAAGIPTLQPMANLVAEKGDELQDQEDV